MGDLHAFPGKRTKKAVTIGGIKYVPVDEFADRVGIKTTTVYQWISEGRLPFATRYLGRLYFEDKAIEPFKKSLIRRVSICK